MSFRQIFEGQLQQQRAEIARQALEQVFTGVVSVSDRLTVGQFLAELEEEPILRDAFDALRLDELRAMTASTNGGSSRPGPNRKRGVTAGRIIAFVRDHRGCSLGQVASALGLRRSAITPQMRSLRARGKLRVEGRERRFQYFAD